MTKKTHHRVWHKKTGKMIPLKTVTAQQGHQADCQSQEQDNNPKTVFEKKFKEQIKKAL